MMLKILHMNQCWTLFQAFACRRNGFAHVMFSCSLDPLASYTALQKSACISLWNSGVLIHASCVAALKGSSYTMRSQVGTPIANGLLGCWTPQKLLRAQIYAMQHVWAMASVQCRRGALAFELDMLQSYVMLELYCWC